MIKFHYVNLNGEGIVILGDHGSANDRKLMVVRLRRLNEADQHDLLQMVTTSQNIHVLDEVLMKVVYPRSRWNMTWMGHLWPYVELFEFNDLKALMDEEQVAYFEFIKEALLASNNLPNRVEEARIRVRQLNAAKTMETKSTSETLYEPVAQNREV